MTMDEFIDIEKIRDIIPHRYPFLLVDRVVEIKEPDFIKGYKNVTINEPFFQGHFPGNAVFPGVLQLEAMAQLGAVLILKRFPPDKRMAYFTGIDKAKFKRMVKPGDRMDLEIKVIKERHPFVLMEGKATVNGELASRAELMCALAT
ncbi:MAG: 3-hydroxyacyl-ACP dehydratase FabZ [Acidobacteriota bacterium]